MTLAKFALGCAAGLLLLLAAASRMAHARVFTVVPPNGEDVCFEEVVVEGADGLRGSFEVLEGGHLDIGVHVTLNGKKTIHKQDLARSGDLDFKEGAGRYRVCFGNQMSSVTYKVVGFSLHGDAGELIEDEDIAKKDHIRPLQKLVEQLAGRVQRLHEHERYLSERLVRHIHTAESTASRVMVSTLVEALVLVTVNVLQILYLKRYFETRRRI